VVASCLDAGTTVAPTELVWSSKERGEATGTKVSDEVRYYLLIFDVERRREQRDLTPRAGSARDRRYKAICRIPWGMPRTRVLRHERAKVRSLGETSGDIAIDLRDPPALAGEVEIETQHTSRSTGGCDVFAEQPREYARKPETREKLRPPQELVLCDRQLRGKAPSELGELAPCGARDQ
jgi:hypothetical protein